MILESLYKMLYSVAMWFIGLFPDIDVSFLETWTFVKGIIIDIFTGIGCLVPMASLAPLVYCTLSLWFFRLILAIVLRLKSLLPLWGGT